jgi:WD40 repeat protein
MCAGFLFKSEQHPMAVSALSDGGVAVACAQYYGLVGNGRLLVLRRAGVGEGARWVRERAFDTLEGLVACRAHPRAAGLIAGGSCGGVVYVWDVGATGALPVARLRGGHAADVLCVDWGEGLWTGGADGAVCLWDLVRGSVERAAWRRDLAPRSRVASIRTRPGAAGGHVLLVGCEDGGMRVVDPREERDGGSAVFGHPAAVLDACWSAEREDLLFSASADGAVRAWDVRMAEAPVHIVAGHRRAIFRLERHPDRDHFLTAS